jgi:hypothetical protein
VGFRSQSGASARARSPWPSSGDAFAGVTYERRLSGWLKTTGSMVRIARYVETTCGMIGDRSEQVDRRATDRRHTPMGDIRERAVPCTLCSRPTWNIDAVCDSCDRRLQAERRGVQRLPGLD